LIVRTGAGATAAGAAGVPAAGVAAAGAVVRGVGRGVGDAAGAGAVCASAGTPDSTVPASSTAPARTNLVAFIAVTQTTPKTRR